MTSCPVPDFGRRFCEQPPAYDPSANVATRTFFTNPNLKRTPTNPLTFTKSPVSPFTRFRELSRNRPHIGPAVATTLTVPPSAPAVVIPGAATGPMVIQLPPKVSKVAPIVVAGGPAPNLIVNVKQAAARAPVVLPPPKPGSIFINDGNFVKRPSVTVVPGPAPPRLFFSFPTPSQTAPVVLPPSPLPQVFYTPGHSSENPDVVYQNPVGLPKIYTIPPSCPFPPPLYPTFVPCNQPPVVGIVPTTELSSPRGQHSPCEFCEFSACEFPRCTLCSPHGC